MKPKQPKASRRSGTNTGGASRVANRQGTVSGRKSLRLRRILVPLDFSDQSRQALECAVPLAGQYGGKIFLLHVVEPGYPAPPFSGGSGFAPGDVSSVDKGCEERLATLARELVPPGLLGETLVRPGRPQLEIVEAADDLGANLIALTTHGHTSLKHVLLGSTAEHVVRDAQCAVLTVRRHPAGTGTEFLTFGNKTVPQSKKPASRRLRRRIMVPVDFSRTSLHAFDVAVPLARDFDAQLVLLSVVEPQFTSGSVENVVPTIPDAERVHEAEAELTGIAAQFVPPSVNANRLVKQGGAFSIITRVAKELDVDLVVLATHGRTGLDRILMGSTAERVVRHAHCPVYVVRAPQEKTRTQFASS